MRTFQPVESDIQHNKGNRAIKLQKKVDIDSIKGSEGSFCESINESASAYPPIANFAGVISHIANVYTTTRKIYPHVRCLQDNEP